MGRVAAALAELLATLWVGGMWAVGYGVAPVLFSTLGDRVLAGETAGRLFALVGWTGLSAGTYLLGFLALGAGGWRRHRRLVILLFAMLGLIVFAQFGIQPLMAELKRAAGSAQFMDGPLGDRFALLHGISSALYLIQSALGALLVLWLRRAPG